MDKQKTIEDAIKLLKENDYLVYKWNEETMGESADRCSENGMDCSECPCCRCLAGLND